MRLLGILVLSSLISFGARSQSESEADLAKVLAAIDGFGAARRLEQVDRATRSLATTGRPSNACPDKPVPATRASAEEHAMWAREGFTEPEVAFLNLRTSSSLAERATHELDLTAIVYRQSGWDPELVKRALPLVGDVFARCGVRLASARFVIANPAYRQLDLTEESEDRVADAVPNGAAKPFLFFGRDNLNTTTKGTAGFSAAYAHNRDGCRGPTCDTAWFSLKVTTSNYRILRNDPVALAIAHELAHLLANEDHRGGAETNLLHGDGKMIDPSLTPAQCATIRSHRSVRPVR